MEEPATDDLSGKDRLERLAEDVLAGAVAAVRDGRGTDALALFKLFERIQRRTASSHGGETQDGSRHQPAGK